MIDDLKTLPSPRSLVIAYRTLKRLSRAVGPGKAHDVGGKDVWESVVEGRRGIAVMTSYLAHELVDDDIANTYAEAWEEMLHGD